MSRSPPLRKAAGSGELRKLPLGTPAGPCPSIGLRGSDSTCVTPTATTSAVTMSAMGGVRLRALAR